MELFVIKNKRGEVVQGNFCNKEEAKKIRNKLQAESKNGLAEKVADRAISKNWDFHISYGKDHSRYVR